MEHNFRRNKIITGNWKMYKTIEETVQFIRDLTPLVAKSFIKIYLAVPFTAIFAACDAAKNTQIVIGAQNMNEAEEGAFTGEIAGRMLKNAGAQFVILGHSERRFYYKETNQTINKKVRRALRDGLQPVVCIGENLEEREEGRAEMRIQQQIYDCLEGIKEEEIKKIMIAYEPIWAIGTGKVALAEDAQTMHHFCRHLIEQRWGKAAAEEIILQYGGSVKPENAAELLKQEDVDGLLIGGASLSVDTFAQIINAI